MCLADILATQILKAFVLTMLQNIKFIFILTHLKMIKVAFQCYDNVRLKINLLFITMPLDEILSSS